MIYNQFLDIMKNFKAQECVVILVLSRRRQPDSARRIP